jgi:preprotein translocase subunit SecY
LTSIDIPNSVTTIGVDAFSGCSALTSIYIPESVITIEAGAFSGCSSLISIDIPDAVTEIREFTFSGCTVLKSIDIPNSIITIPSTIAMFAKPESGTFWAWLVDFCSSTSWFYALMQFILILAFAYFYVAISFNPTEVAGNIQKQGGAIPGIRPGKATSSFIQKVLSKVTFIGALSLSVIAVVPLIVHLIVNAMQDVNIAFQAFTALQELAFAGTSVVIVVGVIIETVREIEAQMTMRHYKGFLG